MASGIKDKVAIIGMGCSRFGERWDCNAEDLMLEAYAECLEDAGIETPQVEAAWLGLCYDEHSMSKSAISLPQALRLANVAVTRVENLCATGSEALRGAVYAVAAGACDIALAMGVEKLKDTGFGGLPGRSMGSFDDLWLPVVTAPGSFAQICTAYSEKHGISIDELKQAMAHVSWKSHENGARNPKAHLRNRVTEEQILKSPMISYPLGMFDCCGVSDGAACAIVTHPVRQHLRKRASHRTRKTPVERHGEPGVGDPPAHPVTALRNQQARTNGQAAKDTGRVGAVRVACVGGTDDADLVKVHAVEVAKGRQQIAIETGRPRIVEVMLCLVPPRVELSIIRPR